MLSLALAAAAVSVMHPAPVYDSDLLLACSAVLGERPVRPGLSIEDENQFQDGLRSLRVTVKETGAFLRVYYDAGSERIAWARAACSASRSPLSHGRWVTGDRRRNGTVSSSLRTPITFPRAALAW